MLKGVFYRVLVLLLLVAGVGCSSPATDYIVVQGSMLGTNYSLKARLDQSRVAEVRSRAERLDAEMKHEMSLFDSTSIMSRLNRGETDRLTPWMEQNIRLADSISRLSGGCYDITVAPLVKAWGFGSNGPEGSPNVDSLLQFVGYEGISIVDGRLVKRDPRMQIDLNSIAKGFTVDRLADILENMGAEDYIVDIGGELRMRGVNPTGNGWRVGVESPIDGNMTSNYLEHRLEIKSENPLKGMATSGNYRRFYLNDEGEKIVHTIDPQTGAATASLLLSVTVLAPTCAEADAYATMLMAAGDERAEELAREIENCEVYLIYNNARAREEGQSEYVEYFSEGMRDCLLD